MTAPGAMTWNRDRRRPDPATIAALLSERARDAPSSVAIAAPERTPLTYSELASQAIEVRRCLRRAGIGPRDRVAIVAPNGPDMAVAFLTIASAAAAVPWNPASRAEELRVRLEHLGIRALVVPERGGDAAREVAAALGIPVLELAPRGPAGLFALGGPEVPVSGAEGEPAASDTALLLETSGTTGVPKNVALTHRQLFAMASANVSAFALTPGDRSLNVMPLFHSTGLVGVTLASMCAGASVVCAPGFYAPEFFGWLEEFRPTWYAAVPTMHESLLARARAAGLQPPRVLRFLRSSSSRLSEAAREGLEALFGAPVLESYGITETGMITCNPLPPGERRAGSVGRACGAAVEIRDGAGRPLPAGARGEITVSGPAIADGYDRDEEETSRHFADGWFRTGDEGYIDRDGYLHLTGRMKEMINRGGEKISPWEIEATLRSHPSVRDAVAFGVAGGSLSEEVAAAVTLRPGSSVSPRELREFAARRLADFKVPRWIRCIDEIPRNPLGKPERSRLPEVLGLTGQAAGRAAAADALPAPPGAWTETEKRVAAIWESVLDRSGPGRDDDFFGTGGDSLLAARLLSRVRDAFGAEISLVAFLDAPTIAGLAGAIAAAPRASAIPARRSPPAGR
jgi:acyl-CoA synthetase (AMP-forming)/AMP-acid ligase II/acyl carrier protein